MPFLKLKTLVFSLTICNKSKSPLRIIISTGACPAEEVNPSTPAEEVNPPSLGGGLTSVFSSVF